jgi:small-conductance mechanosensitive channel
MVIADSEKVKSERAHRHRVLKRCTIYKLVTLTAVFVGLFAIMRIFMPIVLSSFFEYSIYFYVAEIGVAGFLIIRTISQLVYELIIDTSESQARSARSIIVIAGYLIVIAVAVAMMAQNPAVAVVIGTVAGIVLGVAMQSLIGNAIAGMVLAITRPFRIGDTITVYGSTGKVYNIGLLYTIMATTAEGNTVLVPNTSLLTTPIVKERKKNVQASSEAS